MRIMGNPHKSHTKGRRQANQAGPLPAEGPLVSVIIPAMNESRTIAAVVREAYGIHPHTEVIVVNNGSQDHTGEQAESAGAKVLSFPNPLGHDIGRRIGAEAATGRVLLFLDGDIVISRERLKPFIQAVLKGTDVALNDYSGPVMRTSVHPVVEAKHMLNILLNRPDLKGASMTGIPHAISRGALERIGPDALERPPLAQAMAVTLGLRVEAIQRIPVGRMNAPRQKKSGIDPLVSVIIRDHLDAIQWVTKQLGERAGHTDLSRKRDFSGVKG